MTRNDGDDVVQLLIDTGVLTPEDAANIHSVQTEVILQYMKDRDALIPSEEAQVREALTTLIGGAPLAQRLQAKIRLVSIITQSVHRKIDAQGVRTREQRERITGEAFPMVARLAHKPK